MELNNDTLYPITKLAEVYGKHPVTLRHACERYVRTKGRYGMKSVKQGRDWFAYPTDAQHYTSKGARVSNF